MGKKRRRKLLLVGLLAALAFLSLGSLRFRDLLPYALGLLAFGLLPMFMHAEWLAQALRCSLQIAKGEDADPFVRLSGQGEAFQNLYELTDLITDARNNGFVHACRARSDSECELAVKVVPKDQHPLLQSLETVPCDSRGTSLCKASKQPKVETEDFHQFMRTLLKFRHDNVVSYEKFFADEMNFYFVMERCPGLPLPDYMVSRTFWAESDVRLLQQQLLHALAYVHGMGIVHRDVKMENLTVSEDGHLKLLDFGLGCLAISAKGEVGTEGYTAPEVFSRSRYGPGIDIFSAGVCLHVLLSGKPPFRFCERVEERMQQIMLGAKLDAPAFKLASQSSIDLLKSMLDPLPRRRPSAKQALRHAWFDMKELDSGDKMLWSTAESDIEFLKVMGVWSGSFSRSGSSLCVPQMLARIAEEDKIFATPFASTFMGV